VLARRNKPWIVAAAAVLITLVAGGALSTYQYFRAEAARAEAELHAERSQAAVQFLGEMMREMGPRGWGHQPTIADLIDALSERVDVVFADEPVVAADIHSTLGWASLPLEEWGMFEQHCELALVLRRENLGPSDPRTLGALRDVARAQEIRGRNEELVGTRAEIVDLCTERFGENDLQTLSARDDLATAYELLGRYPQAKQIETDVLDRCRRVYGKEHRLTVGSMSHLANILLKLDDRDRAIELARSAHEISVSQLGEGHPTTVSARGVMAASLISHGRLEEAAALYGQGIPREPGIVMAFQGSPEIANEGPQMLVMWETWCPFSQRVVPVAEELYRRHHESGLVVAGLTRVNRSSSDERVELFIRDQGLSFPVLKDNGKSWSYFEATGTPFVVLLVDGRVVWKDSVDSPADLSDRLVRNLMTAYAADRQ
jgi:tetratricopeptide (TPR) repeat protein